MDRITASLPDLYSQAFETARECFGKAIRVIDEEFGEGYSKKHPEIVGMYMQTIVADLNTSVIGKKLQEIGDSLDCIAENIQYIDLRYENTKAFDEN